MSSKSCPNGAAIACALALAWVSCGCTDRATNATPVEMEKPWQDGYALLHGLLSQEANAEKILLVKLESDALDELMTDISTAAAGARDQISGFAEAVGGIELERQPLPEVEMDVRGEIESETAEELLGSSGPEFEARLILTQQEAMRYAANLARVIARSEPNVARKVFLGELDNRCTKLRKRCLALLLSRAGIEVDG